MIHIKKLKVFFIFSLIFLLCSSCTKTVTRLDDDPINPIDGLGGGDILPEGTEGTLGTLAFDYSDKVCNDELGNIYSMKSGSQLVKIDTHDNITKDNPCFVINYADPITVYNGRITANGSTSTNPTYTQSIQNGAIERALCNSTNVIDYNTNLASTSSPGIHTDYSGGIYVIGRDTYRIYYKPNNSNVFTEQQRYPGLSARDISSDQYGNIYIISSDYHVKYFPMTNYVEVPIVVGSINAVKVAVDPISRYVVCIDNNNKPFYFQASGINPSEGGIGNGSGNWTPFINTPNRNFWDICIYDRHVYASVTNGLLETARTYFVTGWWGLPI